MPVEYEFLTAQDKPALLGLGHPENQEIAREVLLHAGYKVHAAANHGDFIARFSQVQYQVVVLDDVFDATDLKQNLTLSNLQAMPMNLRRHAVVFLIGHQFQTANRMQAFQQSVHAVINPGDLTNLSPIIQQVVSDDQLFQAAYREAQTRLSQSLS